MPQQRGVVLTATGAVPAYEGSLAATGFNPSAMAGWEQPIAVQILMSKRVGGMAGAPNPNTGLVYLIDENVPGAVISKYEGWLFFFGFGNIDVGPSWPTPYAAIGQAGRLEPWGTERTSSFGPEADFVLRWVGQVNLQPTLNQLSGFSELQPDWDSYGGSAPSSRAVNLARRLIIEVGTRLFLSRGNRAAPHDLGPTPNGGIEVEWRGDWRSIAVEVGPHGHLDYLLIDRRKGDRQYVEKHGVGWSEVESLIQDVIMD